QAARRQQGDVDLVQDDQPGHGPPSRQGGQFEAQGRQGGLHGAAPLAVSLEVGAQMGQASAQLQQGGAQRLGLQDQLVEAGAAVGVTIGVLAVGVFIGSGHG